jgi:hypothetical protein
MTGTIDTSPQHVRGGAYQFQVSGPAGAPYSIQMVLYADGSETDTAEVINPVVQSLVDLFQGWSGKYPGSNVVAQGPLSYVIAPAVLEETPDPVDPPPGG